MTAAGPLAAVEGCVAPSGAVRSGRVVACGAPRLPGVPVCRGHQVRTLDAADAGPCEVAATGAACTGLAAVEVVTPSEGYRDACGPCLAALAGR